MKLRRYFDEWYDWWLMPLTGHDIGDEIVDIPVKLWDRYERTKREFMLVRRDIEDAMGWRGRSDVE